MKANTLEQKLHRDGGAVNMLRNSQVGPYVFPVAAEFSNWRDEQEAWRKTAVLFDQSHHMTDLYVEGPDTQKLLSQLGVNSFAGFGRDKAKQFVACNYDGFVIGDAVLFGLENDRINIVGRPPVPHWVEYHATHGKYDVQVTRDERSVDNSRPRRTYRYQVQGPNAWQLLEKVNGGPLPEIQFFHMGEIRIAGQMVRALRHGMSGAPGLELWGPTAAGPEIRAAIIEAGRDLGLHLSGARAYSSVATESGWLSSPLPAVYTGESMRPYREALPDTSFEAVSSLGGSFVSNRIEDYYLSPWDLGYGNLVKFDHEFIGRDALLKMAADTHRRKVILSWNSDDAIAIYASMFQAEGRMKYMDMPSAHYSTHPYDAVYSGDRLVGLSTSTVYSSNGRRWISLAVIDDTEAVDGAEVSVVWGEPSGGTSKPVVERHTQARVRTTIGPWPFGDPARAGYRPYVLGPIRKVVPNS